MFYYRANNEALVRMVTCVHENFKYKSEEGSNTMEKFVKRTRIISTVWILNLLSAAILMTNRTLMSEERWG